MALIYLVAGARPNFMKVAPIIRAIRKRADLRFRLVHTGQHYDYDMSGVFFEQLGIPQPDVVLACGGGSHAQQTASAMVGFEALCEEERPDAVVVVGDVNSTLACTLAAKKLGIPVAHVEAGLRSGDMIMPEEINRVVTDSIADWLFVTEPSGIANLEREGRRADSMYFVGHVMIDNLFYQAARLTQASAALRSADRGKRYGVVTLHRPSNVDEPGTLLRIVGALKEIAQELPLVFPAHPRTMKNLRCFGIDAGPRIALIGPQAYMPFLALWKDAVLVLTDSGGLQEETTALSVPCVTIRDSTERPVTVEVGSNVLAGTDPKKIVHEARQILRGQGKPAGRPPLWDGRAAERIVAILGQELAARGKRALPKAPGAAPSFTPAVREGASRPVLQGELS